MTIAQIGAFWESIPIPHIHICTQRSVLSRYSLSWPLFKGGGESTLRFVKNASGGLAIIEKFS